MRSGRAALLTAQRAGISGGGALRGVEISALALPQCRISPAVAAVLRDAGATVTAAASPDEMPVRGAGRALQPQSSLIFSLSVVLSENRCRHCRIML
jgi:hypothetical protein